MFNSEKVIASIIILYIFFFSKNIYVIIMSADTPECAKLNHLKITIFGRTCPLTHKQCTARPPVLSKNYTFIFKYRFTPPNVCIISICRQSMHYHYCFADKVIICTLLMCYY